MPSASLLRAGDLVEVKSREEILGTLDEKACLDGMPFMPEMLRYCGQRLRVAAVAHKTCDTKCHTGGRSIPDCVHLEGSRCDGSGHDGCQARCNLFWKTAWVRRIDAPIEAADLREDSPWTRNEAMLARETRDDTPNGTRYRCQATQILEASKPLAWWDARQYVRDVTSRNASAGRVLRLLILSWFAAWRRFAFPYRLSHWSYDVAHRLLMGRDTPYLPDSIPYAGKAPTGSIGLKVGDRVRVKSHSEIRATLTAAGRNRGLTFDVEMVPFCGKEFRVLQRADKIINELTGEMMTMKNPCVLLDGVVCRGEYSCNRLLCPRAIPPYWREIWLERIGPVEQPVRRDAVDADSPSPPRSPILADSDSKSVVS